MTETRRGFIQLHLSVLLAGFTGLFGRLITLNEVDIVWYRMLFTSLILLVFTGLPRVGWHKFLQLCGCGALLGVHWMLFYGSIKASNVSIGVICFSLIGFFTALFEPLIYKRKISWVELLFSLITVAGVLCIFSLDARYRYGIMIGIASSAVCALYAICNKKASVGVRSSEVTDWYSSFLPSCEKSIVNGRNANTNAVIILYITLVIKFHCKIRTILNKKKYLLIAKSRMAIHY